MGCCCPDNTEKKAQSREEQAKEAAARGVGDAMGSLGARSPHPPRAAPPVLGVVHKTET